MHKTDIYYRIATMPDDRLRETLRRYRGLSYQAADNPRSRYHTLYYRAYAEIERRKNHDAERNRIP